MRHRIIILAILSWILAFNQHAWAQSPVAPDIKGIAIDSITAGWNDWTTVSISGKFKMAGLPLSPTVKIFMERDSVIRISLRAPLLGEVGRAEIADSMILVVNKMNKTYVEEPISKALSYYPGGVADLQNLLLGRIVLPGFGLLSPENQESVEIYEGEGGAAMLVASEEAALPGFNYGYLVSPEWLTAALMVLPEKHEDVVVKLEYEYFDNGYDLRFDYISEKKKYQAILELNAPEWEGKGFDAIRINSRFRKLPFDKFIKSF